MHANGYNIVTPIKCHQPLKHLLPPRKVQLRSNVVATPQAPIATLGNRSTTLEVDDEIVAFWDYQFLFMSQRLEAPTPIKLKLVDGALPQDFPTGTYYLTGPGLFGDDYGSRVNPLDGHGYIRAFEIDGPKKEVRFSSKYVKTEAQIEECDLVNGSWKFTHRGPFSVLKGGKMIANTKVMKNVANTSILKWNKRLFCLWEGGTPYEIDPITLDTIGNFNLIDDNDSENEENSHDASYMKNFHTWEVIARMLKPILYGVFKMPPKRLLSHYKIDARRERLIIMTCNAEDMLLPISHCTFYEFDPNFKLLQKKEFNLPNHSMIHDWAFTRTHYIIFANRVNLNVLGSMTAISGKTPMISALSVDQSKPTSPIYILPRFSSECWREPIEVPNLWLLHVANAYEAIDTDGNLLIRVHASACAYKWFNFQTMFGYNWRNDILEPSSMNHVEGREQCLPHLVEVSIKLVRNGLYCECSVAHLNKWSNSADFPIINPQQSGYKHRYVYAATSSGSRHSLPHFPFDSIVKLDTWNKIVCTWSPGNRRFIGEPMFISRGLTALGEDDGYLLTVEYVVSRRTCNLLVLDSRRIGERNALLARFEVPRSLTFPLGFHGTWTPRD